MASSPSQNRTRFLVIGILSRIVGMEVIRDSRGEYVWGSFEQAARAASIFLATNSNKTTKVNIVQVVGEVERGDVFTVTPFLTEKIAKSETEKF